MSRSSRLSPTAIRLDAALVAAFLPDRPADGHKGTFGSLLAVCGSLDWAGAALLAGSAAVRTGTGLVTLAVPGSLQPVIAGRVPELITMALPETEPGIVDSAAAVAAIAARSHTALVVGPGLRPGPATTDLVMRLVAGQGATEQPGRAGAETVPAPALIDATALNALAATEEWWERRVRLCVLTPHPGEFARLDGGPVGVDADQRVERASAAAARWGAVVVLKGARTVVAAPDGRVASSASSNPALAAGGTGDVLSGIIGSLLAQGVPTWEAACLGVHLHAAAGEHIRERLGDAGLMASDLLPEDPTGTSGAAATAFRCRPTHRLRATLSAEPSRAAPQDIDERLRLAGLPPLTRPMWLEIDVPALASNLTAIRGQVATGTAVWPVVKADGYGHGLEVAARAFLGAGADGVCVATLDEALALRAAGIEGAVLILYPVPAETAEEAARQGFQLVVSTLEGAAELADRWVGSAAAARGIRLRVHVEIETGLGRMGIAPAESATVITRLAVPGLTVAGVWSHLATPEDAVASAAQEQQLAAAVQAAGGDAGQPRASHLAATGGLVTGRGLAHAMVRPGLIAYGVLPTSDRPPFPGLRPAMRLKARALRIVTTPAGTPVGYGGTWIAARESRIATLPVGYGDGYARSLSGAPVLVHGRRVPVVGAVAMDALTVDVTDVPDMAPTEEYVLLGPQGEGSVTALELARWRTTIPWEVLTGMARRTTRVYDAGVGLLGVRTLTGETLVRDAPWS